MYKKIIYSILISLIFIIFSILIIFVVFYGYFGYFNKGTVLRGTYVLRSSHYDDKQLEYPLLKPNKTYNCFFTKNKKLIYNVNYGINEHSFRNVKINDHSTQKILFTGCSFVFGEGLEDYQTIPYVFSELIGDRYQVFNIGYAGTGTHHVLKWLKSKKIKGLVGDDLKYIIYIFIGDHIFRAYEQQKIFTVFEEVDGKIIERRKNSDEDWLGMYSNQKIKYDRLLYKNKAKEFTIRLIEEINSCAKDIYNAEFIVVLWPEEISNSIYKELLKSNINCLQLKFNTNLKNYEIPFDGHPNASGAKEIAEQIFKYIKQKKS